MFSLTPWRNRGEIGRLRTEMDRLFDRFFDLPKTKESSTKKVEVKSA